MIFKHITPSAHLQSFVKRYLLIHFKVNDPNISFIKPYTPSPEQCLTFDPRNTIKSVNEQTAEVVNRTANYISGQQISRLNLHIPNDYLMFKIVFQPGAMYQIFGVPLALMTDQHFDTESVIGNEMKGINEQMANAESYQTIVDIAEKYLWRKIKNRKKEANAVDKIGAILIDNPTSFSLDWLADQACWSPRNLERQFIERIGISPKLLSRISRFDKAFLLKQQNPTLDWLSVAIQTGYNDYQHLVKDFKYFAGVTPKVMLAIDQNSPERTLGLLPDVYTSSR
ncbi:AraC family transcriptional regulator [Emticicia aquatilis]|uniref:AraC family transcriptional regulator n=1 Tax=Emticicia aquatilis TaxID=1537369 RepID=A0A916YPL5_9BACT|nr:helix-turn-helix domain-containing protein [Emticicia aquatilis]GGD55078.1 AraC family transcriptional regulator [Emticicia aquatilis]